MRFIKAFFALILLLFLLAAPHFINMQLNDIVGTLSGNDVFNKELIAAMQSLVVIAFYLVAGITTLAFFDVSVVHKGVAIPITILIIAANVVYFAVIAGFVATPKEVFKTLFEYREVLFLLDFLMPQLLISSFKK